MLQRTAIAFQAKSLQSLLFIILFLFCLSGFAQQGWQPWERLYDDEYVSVDIQYSLSDNACDDEGRLFKYRLKLAGRYRTYPVYVCWKMSFINCSDNLFYQDINAELWKQGGGKIDSTQLIESIDNRFQAKRLIQPYYDITISRNKKFGTGPLSPSFSVDPTGIESSCVKGGTTLTVKGIYLGNDAEWVWHKGRCNGKIIGIGKTIEVKPEESTTYYVRAEGPEYKTNCVRVTVQGTGVPVTPPVVAHSIIPAGISGPIFLCRGDTAKLSIDKGTLGNNSEWTWYIWPAMKLIGTGDSIYVMPLKKTVYYARAEGEFDTTDYVRFELSVFEKSEETFSIVYHGLPAICAGDRVDLEIDNFVPNDDGKWHWYQDSCDGPIVDSEVVVTFHPVKTTTWYLKRDGICNPSNCSSITIMVNEKSDITTAYIIVPDTVYKHKKASLRIARAHAGKDAVWMWYKDTVKPETYIGSGETITYRFWRKGKFLVKAKGMCNETAPVSVFVEPKKKPKKKI
jgi:hypothetical protein